MTELTPNFDSYPVDNPSDEDEETKVPFERVEMTDHERVIKDFVDAQNTALGVKRDAFRAPSDQAMHAWSLEEVNVHYKLSACVSWLNANVDDLDTRASLIAQLILDEEATRVDFNTELFECENHIWNKQRPNNLYTLGRQDPDKLYAAIRAVFDFNDHEQYQYHVGIIVNGFDVSKKIDLDHTRSHLRSKLSK